MYNKADKLLSSSLNHWGSLLATSDSLDPVWSQVLSDPFLRRLLLRYLITSIFLINFERSYFIVIVFISIIP